MTKAQEFMTAVEENNLFNQYSVIALRKANKNLQEDKINLEFKIFKLEQKLKSCEDFLNITILTEGGINNNNQ
jgi:hypothetical protein